VQKFKPGDCAPAAQVAKCRTTLHPAHQDTSDTRAWAFLLVNHRVVLMAIIVQISNSLRIVDVDGRID
jgi:hypothetical protein